MTNVYFDNTKSLRRNLSWDWYVILICFCIAGLYTVYYTLYTWNEPLLQLRIQSDIRKSTQILASSKTSLDRVVPKMMFKEHSEVTPHKTLKYLWVVINLEDVLLIDPTRSTWVADFWTWYFFCSTYGLQRKFSTTANFGRVLKLQSAVWCVSSQIRNIKFSCNKKSNTSQALFI